MKNKLRIASYFAEMDIYFKITIKKKQKIYIVFLQMLIK